MWVRWGDYDATATSFPRDSRRMIMWGVKMKNMEMKTQK